MKQEDRLFSRDKVAKRLVEYREGVTGMSQNGLANVIGISVRTIQTYEQSRADISVELLVRLYERLDLDPLWLLLGVGKDPMESSGKVELLVHEATKLVEMELQKHKATLKPAKHADLVTMIYTRLREEHGDTTKIDIAGLVRLAM